jgi:GNAT superfamily N-acetyltransferase
VAWTITSLDVADAEELGRVHVQVWREAYAGLMPADYLGSLDPVARGHTWREWASLDDPAETWVAREDGEVVGFASAGPARDHPAPAPYELWAINLLARVHGTGLADVLLERALARRDAYLWVVEGNHRARSFYRRHGFVEDGGRDVHAATGVVEVRMTRRTPDTP